MNTRPFVITKLFNKIKCERKITECKRRNEKGSVEVLVQITCAFK